MEYLKYFENFEIDYLNEDGTSATGGAPSAGMGAVVSAQPSGLAGTTIGTNWASGGGTIGSGDISVPYNPSGANRMIEKIPVMGHNHGPRTGKKSRTKKVDMNALRTTFAKKQDFTKTSKDKKVMNFDDFAKSDINKIKK